MSSWLNLPDYPSKFKIKRIPVGDPLTNKRYLTRKESEALFSSNDLVVQEKIDGKQACKRLNHEGMELVLCGEFVKFVHSIFYDSLPSWFVVWDVYDPSSDGMLPLAKQRKLSKELGLNLVPTIFRGKISLEETLKLLDRKSGFSTTEVQEGIVVKDYQNQRFGKIVRQEFIAGIELKGHYLRRRGLTKMNRLAV